MAVASRLNKEGAAVFLYDDKDTTPTRWPQVDGDKAVQKWDAMVLSPAIQPNHPLVCALQRLGVAAYSEPDIGYTLFDKTIVAVTGTNGKTTTVRMLTALLCGAGRRAMAVGNIGVPFCDVACDSCDVAVVEFSSFMAEQSRLFLCDWAAITNIGVDHIAYHGSEEKYRAAKSRLLTMAKGYVRNVDDPALPCADIPCFTYSVTDSAASAFADESAFWLHTKQGIKRVLDRSMFEPIGIHNVYNALCALTLAYAVAGYSPTYGETLHRFTLDPMRLQRISCGNRVAINDSKSTNMASVRAALACVDTPAVLLLGGCDKGEDFTPLFVSMPAYIVRVVVFGQAGQRLLQQAQAARYDKAMVADGVRQAVRLALAIPSTVILFSPGCSSFDAYSSYIERGHDFEKEFRHFAQ